MAATSICCEVTSANGIFSLSINISLAAISKSIAAAIASESCLATAASNIKTAPCGVVASTAIA
ncbi:MAG: hypothetical protein QM811_27470 [Pirellulales bacterium]